MSDQIILDFLKFPTNIGRFPNYEDKIHQQVSSQFADVRALVLSIMKELSVNNKKKLFRVKTTLDKLFGDFQTIQSSQVTISPAEGNGLTFQHEFILILDFLILERVVDFASATRRLEATSMGTGDTEELLSVQIGQLQKALGKLETLLITRKVADKISPSDTMFEKFSMDFEGELSYLETMGVIHQFEELEKPLLIGKKAYKKTLAQLFVSTCNAIKERDVTKISFYEFVDIFRKRYPKVEFDIVDIEDVANNLWKSGVIGMLESKSEDTSKQILLADDSTVQKEIIDLAKDKGFLTREDLISSLGKSIEEVQQTIKKLEDAGLAIEDDNYATGTRYYFPGLDAEEKGD